MTTISRRDMLKLSAMTAGAAILGACAGPSPTPVTEATPKPTETPVANVTVAPTATAKPKEEAKPTDTPKPVAASTKPPAGKYAEAPGLADLVKAGTLPPIDERLPMAPGVSNAVVSEYYQPEIGRYGGMMRNIDTGVQYCDNFILGVQCPIVLTPGYEAKSIVPNIVESFEANSDLSAYTFKLRPGLKWSDGEPVDTQDILYAWEDVWLNQELQSSGPPAWLRSGNKSSADPAKLEILDDFTFRLTFEGPFAGFLLALAIQNWNSYEYILKPRHYLEQFHAKYADPAKLDALVKENNLESWVQLHTKFDLSMWGYMHTETLNLPKLTDWLAVEATDQRAFMQRNPYYWKVDAAGNQLPYIDNLDYTVVADRETVNLKVIAGQSDYQCESLEMGKLALYKQNESQANYDVLFGRYHLIAAMGFLNLSYNDETWRKVTGDLRFRQALDRAVDRNEMIDAVWYGMADPDPRHPPYDPDGAKKLLDEMGMDQLGSDGFRLGPDGKPFVVAIETYDQYNARPAAELYVQFWTAIGVNTTMKLLDSDLWGTRRSANELKADVMFATTPFWFFQDFGQGHWCPAWWQWWTTNGAEGEEPPAEIKDYFTRLQHLLEVPVEEGSKLAEGLETTSLENVYYFAPAYRMKYVFIANRGLANIYRTDEAFALGTQQAFEQTFYKA